MRDWLIVMVILSNLVLAGCVGPEEPEILESELTASELHSKIWEKREKVTKKLNYDVSIGSHRAVGKSLKVEYWSVEVALFEDRERHVYTNKNVSYARSTRFFVGENTISCTDIPLNYPGVPTFICAIRPSKDASARHILSNQTLFMITSLEEREIAGRRGYCFLFNATEKRLKISDEREPISAILEGAGRYECSRSFCGYHNLRVYLNRSRETVETCLDKEQGFILFLESKTWGISEKTDEILFSKDSLTFESFGEDVKPEDVELPSDLSIQVGGCMYGSKPRYTVLPLKSLPEATLTYRFIKGLTLSEGGEILEEGEIKLENLVMNETKEGTFELDLPKGTNTL